MANTTASPIDVIFECLSKAAEAAYGLDTAASEDLRALLRIAASESGRLAKASQKPVEAAMSAAKAKKTPIKAAKPAKVKASSKQPKTRRKPGAANGVAAH